MVECVRKRSLVAGHTDLCFGPHRHISGSLELVKIYGRTFGSECLWPCLVIAAAPVRNGARTFVSAGNERRLRTLDVSRCGLTPFCLSAMRVGGDKAIANRRRCVVKSLSRAKWSVKAIRQSTLLDTGRPTTAASYHLLGFNTHPYPDRIAARKMKVHNGVLYVTVNVGTFALPGRYAVHGLFAHKGR
ncbi:hypothetical protein CBL_14021 [Carabus blaptoides fortunei]